MNKIWYKKIRWCKQTNEYSCGPFLLLNILKWSQYPEHISSKKYIEILKKLCNCCKQGTDSSYFHNSLISLSESKKINFKIKNIMKNGNIKLKDFDKHLDKHGSVALLYRREAKTEIEGHFILVVYKTKSYYVCINDKENRNISKISRKEMRKMLSFYWWNYGCFLCSCAWFLIKQEKIK